MRTSKGLTSALFAGAIVVAVHACSGPSAASCDEIECEGCCDRDGICRRGDTDDACGMYGIACLSCGALQACATGTCVGQVSTGDGGTCRPVPASCSFGSECCSGSCTFGRCAEAPKPDGGTPSCSNITGDRATQVCLRWKCDRADQSEGTWTGSVAACDPGDNALGRTHALKMVNLQRFLAQLPEVTNDPARDAQAQQCALMMHANSALSHTPPSSWACYTAGGATAAGKSNLSTTPGVQAVDQYMVDNGNLTTLGHRRWILSPQLGPIGLGTTSAFSCLWVIGGSGTAAQQWVAWPPPGPFPLEAFSPAVWGGSINTTGWSIQSNAIDLTGAAVTVTSQGNALPVTVSELLAGYGSTWALRVVPNGWAPEAGRRYDVAVTGIEQPISYSVEVVHCP